MAEYCDDEAVRKRLSTAGRKWLADRDRSGTVSADEIADTITENIGIAGREIDAHLFKRYGNVDAIRGQQVPWLRDLCVHIAVWYIVSVGARDTIPGSVQIAYDKAIESLEAIRDGQMDVPGLTVNTPIKGPGLQMKSPRVANV